jgi:hypothetical protein
MVQEVGDINGLSSLKAAGGVTIWSSATFALRRDWEVPKVILRFYLRST